MSGAEWRMNFPFAAIVDQEQLLRALLLNAINPQVGGLLVRGPKGSGKSMAARALADLLPEVEVTADCVFGCSPTDPSNMCGICRSRIEAGEALQKEKRKMRVITLPLGATEDRVVGTLDIEKALREGVRALQPGILAEANQNILYVDEINLLPDHIVDDLLDAAASGWNVVEREAISVAHPSRFILIGTMNPEEGELRPQLLDRLPISVTLQTVVDVDQRVQIVERNLEFKKNPQTCIERYAPEQRNLQQRILRAKEMLKKIEVPKSIIYLASKMCVDLAVDGQRPDIIITEAARTVAALEGRLEILPQDVLEAAKLALNHRTRKGGFEGPATSKEIEEAFKTAMHVYQNVKTRMDGEKEVVAKPGQQSVEEKGAPSPVEAAKTKSSGTLGQVAAKAPKPLALFLLFLAQGVLLGALWLLCHPENPLPSLVVGSIPLAVYFVLYLWWRGGTYFPVPRRWLPALQGLRKRSSVKEETELFKGEGLAEKLKTWIDSRFSAFPDVRVKSPRRSFLAGKRGISMTTLSRGRYRFYEKPPTPSASDIALVPTMKTAAISGHIRRGGASLLQVQPEDIRTKVRVYRAPITLVLVLDVSESMINSLGALAKAVGLLSGEAYRKRDRMALIAFKENSAHVLNHPTTNIRVVAGNIRRLGASGSTPLADGMMKALEVVKQDRRRNKDMIPLVVIISDFLPNIPLKISGRGIDAASDTLYVAQLLRREKIPVVVINTYHFTEFGIGSIKDTHWRFGGMPLATEIARITGGRYYGFAFKGFMMPHYIDSKKMEEIILEATRDTNFLTSTSVTPTTPMAPLSVENF